MSEPVTPRIVLSAVDDIFFAAKIEAAAKRTGVNLIQAFDARQLSEKLAANTPELIILDLNSRVCTPLEVIPQIKADPKFKDTAVLGFFSHVQVELEDAAYRAGCDQVLPRSSFSAHLPRILRGD
jgi:PleD family two-component response regulator